MKLLSIVAVCLLSFTLNGCDSHESSHALPSTHAMQIQHLTLLVEHAINIAAQGADLKQLGDTHADALFKQSADLLRRAMSGPEMSAMHKGGSGASPAMQHLHDLGAAAFDMLDMMMSTPSKQFPTHARQLHLALSMATEAASLNTVADMRMALDIDASMQKHSTAMHASAVQVLQKNIANANYEQAISKVVQLLSNHSPQTMSHQH